MSWSARALTVSLSAGTALAGLPLATAAPAWAVSGYTCASSSVPGAPASDNACFEVRNETVSYVVPKGVTSMRVSLDGAGGGARNGAAGGRTVATIDVTPGETLSLTAGGAGVLGAKRWNVGGGGPGSNGSRYGGGQGGGGTWIKEGATWLVAAGGGGGGAAGGLQGGMGGGTTGQNSWYRINAGAQTAAGGGTQTAGGRAAAGVPNTNCSYQPSVGRQGRGGYGGGGGADVGGGGGGGYYGGGGGTCQRGTSGYNSDYGGGGGSGYVNGPGVTDATTSRGNGSARGQHGTLKLSFELPEPDIHPTGGDYLLGRGVPGTDVTIRKPDGTVMCTTRVPAGGIWTCDLDERVDSRPFTVHTQDPDNPSAPYPVGVEQPYRG